MNTQNIFTCDHANHLIRGSKSALKRASIYGTNEYKMLTQLMQELPTYGVAERIIKKKVSGKISYRNLTLKKMEDYINTQPNAKKNLAKFEAVKRIAEARSALYPLSKKWFLSTFPNYKEDIVVEDEAIELEVAAELDELEAA